MRHAGRTVAAARFASSTRRDLLLEILALRDQLSVLARSNRRFRASDRVLWLILRRLWPRWRDALVLVQPATVDRWHRDRFHRCGRCAHDIHASPSRRARRLAKTSAMAASLGVERSVRVTTDEPDKSLRLPEQRCDRACRSARVSAGPNLASGMTPRECGGG